MPIYRQIVIDISQHETHPGILWWAVVAVAMIQGAYWLRVRLQPPLPRAVHVMVSHLAGFVARLSFVFTSSTFAVVFLTRFDQLKLPPARVVILLLLLFSMFCYTVELERLAAALRGTEAQP